MAVILVVVSRFYFHWQRRGMPFEIWHTTPATKWQITPVILKPVTDTVTELGWLRPCSTYRYRRQAAGETLVAVIGKVSFWVKIQNRNRCKIRTFRLCPSGLRDRVVANDSEENIATIFSLKTDQLGGNEESPNSSSGNGIRVIDSSHFNDCVPELTEPWTWRILHNRYNTTLDKYFTST
jgi:hypothetical protein